MPTMNDRKRAEELADELSELMNGMDPKDVHDWVLNNDETFLPNSLQEMWDTWVELGAFEPLEAELESLKKYLRSYK